MKRHKRLIVHLQPVVNNFTTGRPLIKGNRKKLSGVWSPSRLFASGEQGAWYDPSDLTTMFQDLAGTTPVTADGQTVGLILDKSKGLVLGSEMMQVPTSGTGSGLWQVSGGVVTRNGSTTGQASCATVGTTNFETTKTFLVSFTITNFSGDSILLRVGGGDALQVSGNGLYTTRVYGGGGASINFSPWSGTSGEATISGLTAKEISGNHATAPSDAARPLYKTDGTYHWLQFDGVDDSLKTGVFDLTTTNKVSIFTGIKKIDDTARIVCELGWSVSALDGSFYVVSGTDGSFLAYSSCARGTAGINTNQASYLTAPTGIDTAVIAINHSIPDDLSTIRRNGASGNNGTGDKGTGNFNVDFLHIGSRSGNSLFFNSNIYSLIVRGALSTTDEITDTEAWVNSKTGAY